MTCENGRKTADFEDEDLVEQEEDADDPDPVSAPEEDTSGEEYEEDDVDTVPKGNEEGNAEGW